VSATPLRVVVLGAGLAGLSMAHALKRRARAEGVALSLNVVAADAHPGGQLQSLREDGFVVEWGANAFRTGLGATADLVQQLGLAGERVDASPSASRRFVFHGGRLHRLPSSPWSLLGFKPISWRGRWRVLAEPFAARRVDHEESVHEYAARHLGEEAAELLLGTLVRGVYGGDAKRLSVDAAFPVMREMERGHRSLVVAALAGAAERKREGKATWSFRRGMGTLLERLAKELQGELTLSTKVDHISHQAGVYHVRAERHEWEADALVLAIPPHAAAPLLGGLHAELGRHLQAIEAADIAVTALAFPKEAFVQSPDGYGFLVAPGEPHSVLGVLFESNIFPERAPAGQVLVRAIQGGVADRDILQRDDATLVGNATTILGEALGLRAAPTKSWVWRSPRAIPQYHLGHQERLADIETLLARYPGLEIAGSAYRGVAVGSLIEDAEGVAQRVLERARVARGVAA